MNWCFRCVWAASRSAPLWFSVCVPVPVQFTSAASTSSVSASDPVYLITEGLRMSWELNDLGIVSLFHSIELVCVWTSSFTKAPPLSLSSHISSTLLSSHERRSSELWVCEEDWNFALVVVVMSGDQSFDEDDEEEEEVRTAVKRVAPAAAKPSVSVLTTRSVWETYDPVLVYRSLIWLACFHSVCRKRWRWKRRMTMRKMTTMMSECTKAASLGYEHVHF